MSSQEIYDQLLSDTELAVKAKSLARDPYKLADDLGAAASSWGKIKSNYTLEEGWISSSCYISLPSYLTQLAQYLNTRKKIIQLNISGLTPLESFFEQIKNSEVEIKDQLEYLQRKDLVFFDGTDTKPVIDMLELEFLHDQVLVLQRCYDKLTKTS